jgi:hypothetical protein
MPRLHSRRIEPDHGTAARLVYDGVAGFARVFDTSP